MDIGLFGWILVILMIQGVVCIIISDLLLWKLLRDSGVVMIGDWMYAAKRLKEK